MSVEQQRLARMHVIITTKPRMGDDRRTSAEASHQLYADIRAFQAALTIFETKQV